MASIQEIEEHLNIEIGDKRLRRGRKFPDNNKYYRYDDYYIVSLTQNKWMIVDNSKQVRRLLRKHSWCWHEYPRTSFRINKIKITKFFHQIFLTYERGLVADHINRCRFDNRSENLRIVAYRQNNRNKTKNKNNTSGVSGICKIIKNKIPYYVARIHNDENTRISKSFNITKLGEEQSKRLAIAQRKAWEIEFGYTCE